MTEVKVCLMTQYSDLMFRKYLLKKWSKGVFIRGRLVDHLSIELFVDNILDNLQMHEVELFHCMLDSFIEDYFDSFISDLVDTIVHEHIHYFTQPLPEDQVKKICRLINKATTSEVVNSTGSNLITLS